MTLGQILFYGGIGALLLTVAVGVVFWIKKPKYVPGNAVASMEGYETQQFRSGYPTKPMQNRKNQSATETIPSAGGRTAKIASGATARIKIEDAPGTVALGQGIEENATRETVALIGGGTENLEGTVVQDQRTAPLKETERLDPLHENEEPGATAKLDQE